MDTREFQYVGFWRRILAAFGDSFFFQIIVFLLCLTLFGPAYVSYLGNSLAEMMAISQPGADIAQIVASASGSFSPAESALYFWLPVLGTLGFWLTKSATPSLMAIPAQIVDLRTGQKPSILRLAIRLIAGVLLEYTFGLDYLWIVFNKKRRALHDVIAGTAVIVRPGMVKNGEWTGPDRTRALVYGAIVIMVVAVHYGLSGLLFNENGLTMPLPVIGIASQFHAASISVVLQVVVLAVLMVILVLPALSFRLTLRWLDKWWLAGSALLFAGGLANITERIAMGGGRNIFYASGGARFICVMCGILYPDYFWNAADFFVSLGIYSLTIIFLISRGWLIWEAFRPGSG